ncbi:MAG: hypothetical protein COC06_09665 [Bacteroidales bacterium]|nr:MAG: hypothetical protein COC06_09665 [Bacteroidales bacterium]
MTKPEEMIIQQINQKKFEGYEYIYDNYYSSLCSFSSRFFKSKSDAEDVVQDVILRLWKSNSNFNSTKALTSYLFFSVKNASLNAIRNDSKWSNIDINHYDIKIDDKSIDQVLIEEEYYRQIHLAINKLGPERKRVILLSMEGLSNKEIAEKTGVSVNTVKTLKLKAYRFLREELELPALLFLLHLIN